MHTIEIEWCGTAAFRLRYKNWTVLLDPYLTRNPFANPRLNLRLEDIAHANHVLISHGHFDHIADLPRLLGLNPKLEVWGPPVAIRNLKQRCKKSHHRIHEILNGPVFNQHDIDVEAALSKHVHFDLPLITKTLKRAITSPLRKEFVYPGLLFDYPCGETLSYVLNLGGFRIRFLGSAGPTDRMLKSWAKIQDDCLLLPLQGNSKICEIGAHIVEMLQPKLVIPHHHDDFYPPISESVDLSLFKHIIKKRVPQTSILELRMNERKILTRDALRPVQSGNNLQQNVPPC